MAPAYDKKNLLKSAYNYTQAGEWDRALEEYHKMTRLFPEDPNIHSMIADLLAKKGDTAAAAREYMAAARQYRDLELGDKELASYRRALKVQPGNETAEQAVADLITRHVARAKALLAKDRFDAAAELCERMLDAEPGNLAVNRLLDEVRTRRMQADSAKAMREEEEEGAKARAGAEATREVLRRLRRTADQYLSISDLDNAIETLMIMLKIDPVQPEIRTLLEATQHQLATRQKAQDIWTQLQSKEAGLVGTARESTLQAKEDARWKEQDQDVQKRLEKEREAADRAAAYEKEIIESAVRELKAGKAALPGTAGEMASALKEEKQARMEAEMREKLLQEQVKQDQEKLQHAIEMARHEAEAQAKAATLKELKAVLEEERKKFQEALDRERASMAVREEALRAQMTSFMAQEMQKHEKDAREKALEDMKSRLEEEQKLRSRLEAEAQKKELEALAPIHRQQEKVEAAIKIAEEKARKERDAIEAIKKREGERKKAILEEAQHRRQARQDHTVERKQVIQDSKRISEAMHQAVTKHMEQDVAAMLETAQNYLKQDLLLDAMRICQTIVAKDPENEKVKEILREIYVRKGL